MEREEGERRERKERGKGKDKVDRKNKRLTMSTYHATVLSRQCIV